MKQRGEDTRTLGEYVRARRLANGWTLSEAARRSDVDLAYLSRLELGGYQTPNPRYLSAIARALDVQPEDLYGLAGYDIPERLPALAPYMRTKYDMPPEAVRDLEKYFELLRNYYDIPEDQPVFPPIEHEDSQQQSDTSPKKATGRNRGDHPWRTS